MSESAKRWYQPYDPQPIHGRWKTIATCIANGCSDDLQLARETGRRLDHVRDDVRRMIAAGFLHQDHGPVQLTKRCKTDLGLEP